MKKAKKPSILVTEDLADDAGHEGRSKTVREVASSLARTLGAGLDLAHVDHFDFSPVRGEALEELMGAMVAKLHERLSHLASEMKPEATPVLIADRPVEGLLRLIAKKKPAYELVVMGTHGRTGLKRLVLGSVAEELLRQSPVPVVTIGPEAQARHSVPKTGGTILLASDLGPSSRPARETAIRLAQALKAKVHIVHCLYEGLHPVLQTAFAAPSAGRDLAGLHSELVHQAAEGIKREEAAFRKAGIECGTQIDERSLAAASSVALATKSVKPSLVVLGTHGRSLVTGAFIGRTVRDVILESPVPVVVARSRSK